MPAKARRPTTCKTATRAAHIGMAALRRRIEATRSEAPDAVLPLPHRGAERAVDIKARLDFLVNRRERGEDLWGDRAITEAIADCRAELEQALEQERHHRR